MTDIMTTIFPPDPSWLYPPAKDIDVTSFVDGGDLVRYDAGNSLTYSPPELLALERLVAVLVGMLSLTDGERAFIDAAGKNPADTGILHVFADWLEERGRGDEAAWVRGKVK